MPSMGASIATHDFEKQLKGGKEITWNEIVQLSDLIGGEIRVEERDFCYQGIISGATLENGVVSISCLWVLRTPVDQDGDPVGDFCLDKWEVVSSPKNPITISVPKEKYQEQPVMVHTAIGSFASNNWAVRRSKHQISFLGGSGTIFLKGYEFQGFAVSVRQLAPRFELPTE